MIPTELTTRLAGVLLCLALVSSVVAAPAAAAQHEQDRFLVDLGPQGHAGVSVTYTYDLATEDERTAFEALEANETARQRLAARFENRMAAVADDASATTGRRMVVGDPRVEIESADRVGIVTLSVRWEHLAAVDGERLIVTEPFASGFEPGRPFTVRTPEGYAIASASPSPAARDDGAGTWEAGADLQGLELILAPSDAGDDSSGDGGGPGAVLGVIALLGAALLARR